MAEKDNIKFPTEGWVYTENIQQQGKFKGNKDRSWKKIIEGRMIVFHSRRKAMEFIDAHDTIKDEKKAVEKVCGYENKFNDMKRRTKVAAGETPEEKRKVQKRKKTKKNDAHKEIVELKRRLKSLEDSLTVYKKN